MLLKIEVLYIKEGRGHPCIVFINLRMAFTTSRNRSGSDRNGSGSRRPFQNDRRPNNFTASYSSSRPVSLSSRCVVLI